MLKSAKNQPQLEILKHLLLSSASTLVAEAGDQVESFTMNSYGGDIIGAYFHLQTPFITTRSSKFLENMLCSLFCFHLNVHSIAIQSVNGRMFIIPIFPVMNTLAPSHGLLYHFLICCSLFDKLP